MFDVYVKVFRMLDQRERQKFILLMGVLVIVAFAELIGVSAVFVLLGMLAQPEGISDNRLLMWGFETFGFASLSNFQIALAAAVFVVVMLGLVIKATGTYAIIRFSNMRSYSLSSRLLEAYLYQPYVWFLTRNSSDTSHRVLTEVDRLVSGVIMPSLRLLSSAVLSFVVIGFLVVVDPMISILSAVLLCGGYGTIYLWLRGRMRRAGHEMVTRSAERYRLVNELSGGFREVKLLGNEEYYNIRYETVAHRHAAAAAGLQIMTELPRFVLEALTFGVLLVVVFVLLLRNDGDLLTTIPTLGIFAYAVMRLLPALQQIYHGLASMRGNIPALELVYNDLMEARSVQRLRPPVDSQSANAAPRIALEERLDLVDVVFHYPKADRPAFDGVSLSITARQTIGIVGGTGAGKTTLVDLVLGLLSPDEGEIRVDGLPITSENLRSWQQTLGYVPQTIYLTDDTIASNIAFGLPLEQIDFEAVEHAARLAALHEFVVNELPDGYQSIVGERGVRLSGGQRQRIGIARALYHNPSVLILDEATSALDNVTERVVMEAISSLRDDKTIIIIAHRLTTVRNCDKIFMMECGRLVDQGSFEALVSNNARFREMAIGQNS